MNELLLLALLTAAPADTLRSSLVSDSASDSVRSAVAADRVIGAPRPQPSGFGTAHLPLLTVTGNPATSAKDSLPQAQGRRRAIQYSDWYGRRLTIHRIGSYTMLPLFATEYWLGNKLMNDLELASWVRPTHATVASGIGLLFAANTVTGVWNLWDARHDPNDRARRTIHAVAMLAADAGFLWTASLAEDDDEGGPSNSQQHKNAALASIGVSTLGTAMMWLWKK